MRTQVSVKLPSLWSLIMAALANECSDLDNFNPCLFSGLQNVDNTMQIVKESNEIRVNVL